MIYVANPKSIFLKSKLEIKKLFENVLDSGSYILGEEVKKFENNFAKYCNVKHGVAVGNATDAIEICLRALKLKKGDKVLTVSHTAIATISAIVSAGLTPKFLDVSSVDFNMDINQLEKKITKDVKVIIIVHLYGQTSDMSKIKKIAKENSLFLIEDCSQAHGAMYKNKIVGGFGDFGIFSFYPTKNLATLGDAGLITTNNRKLYEKVFKLREYGWNNDRESEIHGKNSRMDEIHAAILNIQLEKLDENNDKRRKIADYYDKNFKDLNMITPIKNIFSKHVYHQYVVQLENRDELMNFLKKNNIITGIHYKKPSHEMKAYKKYCDCSLPVTEYLKNKILSLPVHSGLKKKDTELVVKFVKKFFENKK